MTSFQNLDQATTSKVTIEGQSYLFFGGTAYLGLLGNAEYIELFKEGIDKYGLNNGTSRLSNIQLGIYDEVEAKMSIRFGFEAAVTFSSGYLAAQVAVRALKEDREVLYAPGSHPALWLDSNPTERETFQEWAQKTVAYINNSIQSTFLVVSNCIDNLQPATYDFSIFDSVSKDKDVLLLLDDSHGIGVVYQNSISSNLDGLKLAGNIEIVVVASLAKGMGTDAGLILGTSKSLRKVKKHPIFVGASPASPAAMYALANGDTIYKTAFDKLHFNMAYFKRHLPINSGLRHIDNFPVFSSVDSSLYRYLCQNNVLISSFPYPLPASPLLNRVIISALHSETDLNYLLEKYNSKSK